MDKKDMVSLKKFCEINGFGIQIGRAYVKHGIISTTEETGPNGGTRIFVNPQEVSKLIENTHYVICPSCKTKLLNINKQHIRDCDPTISEKYAEFFYERLKTEDSWTIDEENLLRDIYPNNSRDFILSKIKRTWKSIREKTNRLGIARSPEMISKDKTETTKKNNIIKYGVESTWELSGVKEKIKQTNLQRHGVEYPQQSKEIRQKTIKSVQEKYGVDNVFQSEEIKKRIEDTNIENFGVKSPLQNKEIYQKMVDTNQKRYGVDNPLQIPNAAKNGMIRKHGKPSPLQVPEIFDRATETNRERYGVDRPSQNKDIQKKTENTNMIRYGVKAPSENEAVKQKIRETNIKKYGVDNPMRLEKTKEKVRKATFKKYGVESFLQIKEVREKAYEAIKKNKSFNKSKEEIKFLTFLRIFDSNTMHLVEHPTLRNIIDYFMPKYDLWVQFDGTYWHGKTIRKNVTRQSLKIQRTVKRDRYQNEHIPNLIRFWSDDVKEAIKNDSILNLIEKKISDKTNGQTTPNSIPCQTT